MTVSHCEAVFFFTCNKFYTIYFGIMQKISYFCTRLNGIFYKRRTIIGKNCIKPYSNNKKDYKK